MTETTNTSKRSEISQFILKFEGCRLKNKLQEKELRDSIRTDGVLEPLEVIENGAELLILNGFKRYRAAKKLGINILPWIAIGGDETTGVVNLIQQSNSKRLNILEEAKFLKSLEDKKQSVSQISILVDKSIGWVSMRIQLLKDLHPDIEQILFSGRFPVYAYMYIVRPFIRMKGVSKEDVQEVAKVLSDKNLSIRQIEYLVEAWFRGSEKMKEQIRAGKVNWVLKHIQEKATQDASQCTEYEVRMLRIMELILEHMKQFQLICESKKLKSNSYRCQAHYLTNAILSHQNAYVERMKSYHDYLGQTSIDLSTSPTRS